MLDCLVRRTYDPAQLVAAHPPKLRHPYKQLAFDVACPRDAIHAGPIELTRWAAMPLPAATALAPTEVIPMPGHFDYAGSHEGVWHLNFADPELFFGYGTALLAQDELQGAEHPLLGSLREALVAEGQRAITEDNYVATPVLVANVERRCEIRTAPDADNPLGLYGNRFAAAPEHVVRRAIRALVPPTRTNLIAIAAPAGGFGAYDRETIERVIVTAYTGYSAAIAESQRLWPGVTVEIRTGFWGCGAFGGNRHVMTLLQLLAARLAGVARLRFYVFDDSGLVTFRTGEAHLAEILALGAPTESLATIVNRVTDRGYVWGHGDGN